MSCGFTPCPPPRPNPENCLPFWVTEDFEFLVTDEVGNPLIFL